MRILHFAIENFARVPGNLVRAERELGHDSFLITLYPSRFKFHDEDICLNLPFVANPLASAAKRLVGRKKPVMTYRRRKAGGEVPVWSPKNRIEKQFIAWRDGIWEKKVRKVLQDIQADTYDLLVLEGGAGFLRSGRIVRELGAGGMPIALLYCGSDFRTRGVIPAVEAIADFRFTVEHDHTLMDPGLHFLYFPFRLPEMPKLEKLHDGPIRIGHSPTNRVVKGTGQILAQLEVLQSGHDIEIVMIENLPYAEALALKQSCHLFVETIGELGYGISALEALAMGIPTACQILPDFEHLLGEHPFINVDATSIAAKLEPFIQSAELRKDRGEKSRNWVENRHDPRAVAGAMHKVMNAS